MLIGIVEDDVHYLELLKRKLDDCKQEEDEIRLDVIQIRKVLIMT